MTYLINIKLSKGIKIIIGIFIFFFIADTIVTYMNFKYIPYLESNPLYLTFKSMIPILIINFILIFLLIYQYNKNKGQDFGGKFFIANIVAWIALARIFAIKSNIKVFITQPPMELAQAVPEEAKLTGYAILTIAYIFIPMIITQIVYFLFRIDHDIVLKKKRLK